MTSAMEDNQYIIQALNASADGYVTKPIEKWSFIETLKETGLLMETHPKPVGV
jgi:DNA-binding NarL/FixJ family response regulator